MYNRPQSSQKKQNQEGDSMNLGRDVRQMQNLFREIQDDNSQVQSPYQQQLQQGKNNDYNPRSTQKPRRQQNYSDRDIEREQQIPQENYQDQNFQALNEQLKNRIAILENNQNKSNETNEILYKKLIDQEQQLQETKNQLKRVHGEKSWKNNQLDDLNYKFHDASNTHNDYLKNARNHSETLQKELMQKEKEIRQLRSDLNEANKKLSVVTVTQEKNMDQVIYSDKRIQQLENEVKMLRDQLSNSKLSNDALTLTKKAEGTFLVEVEHLRADIKRLVTMLRSTSEFKEFADLADDAGQIRYLKDVKALSYVDYGAPCKCKINRPCVDEEIVDERCLWVPEEAWKFAHNFRLQYDGELTENLIERLLFEFSKIWSRREQLTINRVKAQCAHDILSLKRQLKNNPTYDEHQAKATITRLKKQLKDAYKENREIYAQRNARNPPGVQWVQETVKVTSKANRDIKKCSEKSRVLREKLQDIYALKFQDHTEKTLFMEGGTWVARSLLKDADKLQKQWKNISAKFPGGDSNVQEMDQLVYNYADKVMGYKANCQKEMLLAQQQLAKINRGGSSLGIIGDNF